MSLSKMNTCFSGDPAHMFLFMDEEKTQCVFLKPQCKLIHQEKGVQTRVEKSRD